MKIFYNALWQNWNNGRPDDQFVRDEMYCMWLAEELGFDAALCPEHHFDADYSASPDNFQVLAYLAAKTSKIQLCLGAVILPWHDPVRVAERICLLDHLCEGRLLVGFGRGLAKMEYEALNIDMNESRERFDEASAMIVRALETGIAQGDGPFYPQRPVEIRPGPTRSFDGRLLSVGMSPESAMAAGDLGAGLLCFVAKEIEAQMPMINDYRARYRVRCGGLEPPPVLLTDFTYCHHDSAEVERVAELYLTRYYQTIVRHYDFGGKHFENTKGYAAYAKGAEELRSAGMDAATKAYIQAQIAVGTPEQIIEKYRHRIKHTGTLRAGFACSYGGMPVEMVEASMRLLAKEVFPEIRKLDMSE